MSARTLNATPATVSRRHALKSFASGFGYLAFAGLAHDAAAKEASARAADGVLAPKATHFPPRARRVIFLCMNGGPSHVDTFDYKPALNGRSGEASTVGRDRGGATLLGHRSSSRNMASRASGFPRCFRCSRSRPTISA